MITQLGNLKQCQTQIRKCQSWMQAVPIDFAGVIEALDVASDQIDKRLVTTTRRRDLEGLSAEAAE